MKFWQRILLLLAFSAFSLWLLMCSAALHKSHSLDPSVQNGAPPRFPVDRDSQVGVVRDSLEDMRETLELVKGHLSVIRKELGLSVVNASYESQRSSQRLYERLRRDPSLQDGRHVASLRMLAKALRDADRDSGNKVDPEDIQDAGGEADEGKEQEVIEEAQRNAEDRDNYRVNPNLTPEMLELLQEVVDKKMAVVKRRKKGHGMEVHTAGKKALYAWQKFHNAINQYELYGQFDPTVDQLLRDLAHKSIVGLEEIDDLGTQVKLVLKLNYGGKALFKPMRFSKDAEANPNHFIFDDFERHHAEIAAFHLDRVLNFRRVPPVSGRYVNLTRDIERWASNKLRKTFFTSPALNRCFYGICDTYCESGQAVCGHPDVLEGSLAAWLPENARQGERQHWANPWAQSYSMRHPAPWKGNDTYCQSVRSTPPYDRGRRLLDLIDVAIFDFLTGNMDRHHYHTFKAFGNFTFILLFDNGRGFGRPRHDELGLLAALEQCCRIRASTLGRLLGFARGAPSLSQAMHQSLSADVLHPVLNQHHLVALDRRLHHVVEQVHRCGVEPRTDSSHWDQVVIHDGF